MARTISVKIPVVALIEQMEAKIAEIDKAVATYPSDYEKYEKEVESYKKKISKFAGEFIAKNANKVGFEHDAVIRLVNGYRGLELTIDTNKVDLPERPSEPKRPNQNEWFGREHSTRRQMIEKNLKILRMTTQEEVNASTYGAVMELL
tara:strand:+ start:34 stop:477 length:444 start_codon:yes stop_codon:yes gene_type:complete